MVRSDVEYSRHLDLSLHRSLQDIRDLQHHPCLGCILFVHDRIWTYNVLYQEGGLRFWANRAGEAIVYRIYKLPCVDLLVTGPRPPQSLHIDLGVHDEYRLHLVLFLAVGILVVPNHLRYNGGWFTIQRQHHIPDLQDPPLYDPGHGRYAHGLDA